jgi:hypothetical protein
VKREMIFKELAGHNKPRGNLVPRLVLLVEERPWSELVTWFPDSGC